MKAINLLYGFQSCKKGLVKWLEGGPAQRWDSIPADRRENQRVGRLAGRDTILDSRPNQASRPEHRRGVEVKRGSGLVSRGADLHRRDVQQCLEDSPRGRLWRTIQASLTRVPRVIKDAPSTFTRVTSSTRRPWRLWLKPPRIWIYLAAHSDRTVMAAYRRVLLVRNHLTISDRLNRARWQPIRLNEIYNVLIGSIPMDKRIFLVSDLSQKQWYKTS